MRKHIRPLLALAAAAMLALAQPARAEQADPAKAPKPAGKGSVKVFILAGQSNMEGQGVADLEGKDYNNAKGTLATLMKDPAKAPLFKHLRDDQGRWTVRDNVWVWYKPENGPVKAGPLTLGFTPYGGKRHFGPELQFGHVVGDYLDNQVLLIKTAWGGKSLYKDFRPPSSGGQIGPYYTKMVADIREALANLKQYFPAYDGGGYQLAGFVWYHGWNDGCDPKNAVPEYEQNLVNLIKDLRKDLKSPDLPLVVGELTGPWVKAEGSWAALRKAQADAAACPDFKGTVLFVETHDFVRKPEDSPCPGHGHHEFANAETYFLVGNALGEGMKKLLAGAPPRVEGQPASALPNVNQLTDAEKAAGWKLLFDGKTAAGWRNFKKPDVSQGWQVIDGALCRVDKTAGDIITAEQYDNFVLELDYKVPPHANSGIMYRVTEDQARAPFTGIEVQILDNTDPKGDSQKSGWAYALYQPPDDPKTGKPLDATKPVGEWNHVKLVCNGQRIEHWMNGVKYCEYEIGSEDWNQRVAKTKFATWPGFAKNAKGHIALQGDHGDVSYTNIKLLPLPTK